MAPANQSSTPTLDGSDGDTIVPGLSSRKW